MSGLAGPGWARRHSKHLVGLVTDDPVETLFRAIAADPHGTFDPRSVEVAALPAQVAADDDDGPSSAYADVVDAELVDEPATNGRKPTIPPKHIREALERLL